ncbi:uncharacterized protein EAE97_006387 [Botrytis byssoidea]|uniref:BTB domain-containing protein n=1 Tax=Botrytis byssoidea TaxID=139641 RepID=A0A9P5ILW6_9HELO|nr:uncharacterized protein EAE97_006387 [Botrytis byssoidea]KAF7942933.1 hypothetical protein EAE97_006387 [Botrytis byssoidea]
MKFFEAFPCKYTIEVTEGAETIDFFVQWLYTPGRFFKVPEIKTVLDLWLFAGRIKCTKLQNYSMDFIQKYYYQDAEFMDLVDLKYVASATKHECGKYNVLREFCALQLHYQNENEDREAVRHALLDSSDIIDLYLEYEKVYCLDTESDPRSPTTSPCQFHVYVTNKDLEDCQTKLE